MSEYTSGVVVAAIAFVRALEREFHARKVAEVPTSAMDVAIATMLGHRRAQAAAHEAELKLVHAVRELQKETG